MDVNRFAKLACGREWVVKDEEAMRAWIARMGPEVLAYEEYNALIVALYGSVGMQALANDQGISRSTVYARVSMALKVLGGILKQNNEEFLRSIFEYQFSNEVDWIELSTAIYGKPSQNIKWFIRGIKAGTIKLPMPKLKKVKRKRSYNGNGEVMELTYIWTKKQAEIWRKKYVEGGK